MWGSCVYCNNSACYVILHRTGLPLLDVLKFWLMLARIHWWWSGGSYDLLSCWPGIELLISDLKFSWRHNSRESTKVIHKSPVRTVGGVEFQVLPLGRWVILCRWWCYNHRILFLVSRQRQLCNNINLIEAGEYHELIVNHLEYFWKQV